MNGVPNFDLHFLFCFYLNFSAYKKSYKYQRVLNFNSDQFFLLTSFRSSNFPSLKDNFKRKMCCKRKRDRIVLPICGCGGGGSQQQSCCCQCQQPCCPMCCIPWAPVCMWPCCCDLSAFSSFGSCCGCCC